jgi:molybdopterin converting factor small subunit
MTLDVLLFGPLASRAGTGQVTLTVEGFPVSCETLRKALARSHPELAESLPLHRFAVNAKFVGDEDLVRMGDEVALIGMVSGG